MIVARDHPRLSSSLQWPNHNGRFLSIIWSKTRRNSLKSRGDEDRWETCLKLSHRTARACPKRSPKDLRRYKSLMALSSNRSKLLLKHLEALTSHIFWPRQLFNRTISQHLNCLFFIQSNKSLIGLVVTQASWISSKVFSYITVIKWTLMSVIFMPRSHCFIVKP